MTIQSEFTIIYSFLSQKYSNHAWIHARTLTTSDFSERYSNLCFQVVAISMAACRQKLSSWRKYSTTRHLYICDNNIVQLLKIWAAFSPAHVPVSKFHIACCKRCHRLYYINHWYGTNICGIKFHLRDQGAKKAKSEKKFQLHSWYNNNEACD